MGVPTENGNKTDVVQRRKRGRPIGSTKKKGISLQQPDHEDNHQYLFRTAVTCGLKASIYDVKFHLDLKPGEPRIFAIAVSNEIQIYRCEDTGQMTQLLRFTDNGGDIFYALAWSHDTLGRPVLAAAGLKGAIRVLSLAEETRPIDLIGHTYAINDIKFHPKCHFLLFSASKDHSIRLWNVDTKVMIAIFHGEGGHRDEVLSLDIDPKGTWLLSGGMDHAVKIWNLASPKLQAHIRESGVFAWQVGSVTSFPTLRVQFSDLSTRDIHGNYVDCVRWFGDLVISKACSSNEKDKNEIVIWKPGSISPNAPSYVNLKHSRGESRSIRSLPLSKCQCWFLRFDVNLHNFMLSVGNEVGEVCMFDLNTENVNQVKSFTLKGDTCRKVVRQTAFSRSGSTLISVSDDGMIRRWDKTPLMSNGNIEVQLTA